MERFLVISDEMRVEQDDGIGRVNRYANFDIIPAPDAIAAAELVKERRPQITHTVCLPIEEIQAIYDAMLHKTEARLLAKFHENTP